MQTIIQTLLPIFFLISLGYLFKRIKFPNEEFWKYMDKFTYFILFPALLLYKLTTAKLENIDGYNFILSAILTMLCITIVLMILNKLWLSFRGDSFTSVYQGSIRFNTYVFLALADALFADTGIVLAALLMTFLIPSINIFCITIFSIYVANDKVTIKSFTKSILTNPLIVSCVIGGSLNYMGISFPTSVENTLALLSSAALPMGLLSVGVGLHLSSIKSTKIELLLSTFLKLIAFPLLIFVVGKILSVDDISLTVLILFASMPTASSAYILARQLGGDVQLMSAIITVQTIVSMFTIILILSLLI